MEMATRIVISVHIFPYGCKLDLPPLVTSAVLEPSIIGMLGTEMTTNIGLLFYI